MRSNLIKNDDSAKENEFIHMRPTVEIQFEGTCISSNMQVFTSVRAARRSSMGAILVFGGTGMVDIFLGTFCEYRHLQIIKAY